MRKLTTNQSRYQKEIRRIRSSLSRLRKEGYDVSELSTKYSADFPSRVTAKKIAELENITPKKLRQEATYVGIAPSTKNKEGKRIVTPLSTKPEAYQETTEAYKKFKSTLPTKLTPRTEIETLEKELSFGSYKPSSETHMEESMKKAKSLMESNTRVIKNQDGTSVMIDRETGEILMKIYPDGTAIWYTSNGTATDYNGNTLTDEDIKKIETQQPELQIVPDYSKGTLKTVNPISGEVVNERPITKDDTEYFTEWVNESEETIYEEALDYTEPSKTEEPEYDYETEEGDWATQQYDSNPPTPIAPETSTYSGTGFDDEDYSDEAPDLSEYAIEYLRSLISAYFSPKFQTRFNIALNRLINKHGESAVGEAFQTVSQNHPNLIESFSNQQEKYDVADMVLTEMTAVLELQPEEMDFMNDEFTSASMMDMDKYFG